MAGAQNRPLKKGRWKEALRRIVLILLGLILGFNVYLMNAKSVGNQLPMPFGIGQAVVKSGSMEPTYYVGDLLFVNQSDTYAAGDVVVFQSDGILVVHRIINVDGSTITTQGDANNASDDPIDVSNVKGKVIGCVPKAGYIIEFFKTPAGIFLIIALAVALVEISFQRDKRVKQEESARHKKDLQGEIDRLKGEIDKQSSEQD